MAEAASLIQKDAHGCMQHHVSILSLQINASTNEPCCLTAAGCPSRVTMVLQGHKHHSQVLRAIHKVQPLPLTGLSESQIGQGWRVMQMNAEAVQRQLKETVAAKWDAGGCHDSASLWKMVGLVDFFLPFLPLERPHLARLFHIRLNAAAADLLHSHQADLTWDPAVIAFLCDKVA